MMRQHTNVAEIIRLEKSAWKEYLDYLISKMPIDRKTGARRSMYVMGDATSHLLFRKWQAIRARRDVISDARYKRDNIRFQRQR
jgi:hypothetical protein